MAGRSPAMTACWRLHRAHGHFTSGGMEDRIEST
ncbi:MAG: hypothetical protein FD148_3440, partial [Methylocystaceae bacterium]